LLTARANVANADKVRIGGVAEIEADAAEVHVAAPGETKPAPFKTLALELVTLTRLAPGATDALNSALALRDAKL